MSSYQSSSCTFSKCPMQNVVSAEFLKPPAAGSEGLLATGMPSGEIYLWKLGESGGKAVRTIMAHKSGPSVVLPDGQQTFHGLRCLKLRADHRTLLSAGADGCVHQWDVADGNLTVDRLQKTIQLPVPFKNDPPPVLRALDSLPGSDVFVAGSNKCDVWEVDETPEPLIFGHSADLYQVAWHPRFPEIFATACESTRVCLFDAAKRALIRNTNVGFQARSVCFSQQPVGGSHHLAIGGKSGRVKIVDEPTLQTLCSIKECNSAIDDLKYSPDNSLLATASHDTFIDLFNVEQGYQHVARCKGHSSTVRHLDWSTDSALLQSNCSGYEILYWDAETGKQVLANQRDTAWHTWTCILGFPVMGIWPEGADGTDINSSCRSAGAGYLATCDDSGIVRLYNYPCVVEKAPAREYYGHSAHVMCVRFSAGNEKVLTAGGRDRAVFQYRFIQTGALEAVGRRQTAGEGEEPHAAHSRGEGFPVHYAQLKDEVVDLKGMEAGVDGHGGGGGTAWGWGVNGVELGRERARVAGAGERGSPRNLVPGRASGPPLPPGNPPSYRQESEPEPEALTAWERGQVARERAAERSVAQPSSAERDRPAPVPNHPLRGSVRSSQESAPSKSNSWKAPKASAPTIKDRQAKGKQEVMAAAQQMVQSGEFDRLLMNASGDRDWPANRRQAEEEEEEEEDDEDQFVVHNVRKSAVGASGTIDPLPQVDEEHDEEEDNMPSRFHDGNITASESEDEGEGAPAGPIYV
ncbi:hypothetical protein CYMTET_15223 [Cymbomonas tetramitiformis]|uniref:EML-like second beta-propeller domain-containing protein n=1 Tax=Cymbomonas tetramitiformis TaxID=36881 RepID=A0AAE0GF03_9CHLO|nr:hypothetical protein CYMTET_15223 [Cymbomonas tetramitiformis]